MSWIVVDLLSDHGTDHADLICDRTGMRKKVGNFDTCLAVFFETREGTASDELVTLELSELLALGERFRKRFVVEAIEFGFGIEGFQMRRPTGHAEMDHAFCFSRKM